MVYPTQQKRLKVCHLQSQAHHDPNSCPSSEDLLEFAYFQLNQQGQPDRKIGRHLLKCQKCTNEYSEIVRDFTVSQLIDHNDQAKRSDNKIPEHNITTAKTAQPLFRSDRKAIIHSDLVPLGGDYVILELSSVGNVTLLRLEKGPKNSRVLDISLYNSKRLVEKRYLRGDINWDLEQLAAGEYSLKAENKTILKFNIIK